MNLTDFVGTFLEQNSMFRLVKKIPGGHETVEKSWDTVYMNWQANENVPRNLSPYLESKVIGVTSIFVRGHFSEAINIIIE